MKPQIPLDYASRDYDRYLAEGAERMAELNRLLEENKVHGKDDEEIREPKRIRQPRPRKFIYRTEGRGLMRGRRRTG